MQDKIKINNRLLKDSNLIVQGNKLINARYKLTVQEGRLFYATMSLIKPEDEDFKKYKINVSEIASYLDLVGGNIYSSLRKVTHSLISKSIVIEDDDGWKEFPLLTFAEYEKSDNSITLQFHPEMKPFLLQQKQNFTQSKLQNLIKYGSSYTSRIYLFLREYVNFKRRDVLVEDLKNKLELDNYEYNDLKRRVLLPAKAEMECYSDIRFELVEHKERKKINKITFLIYKNSPSEMEELKEIEAQEIDQQEELENSFAKILYKKYNVSKNVGLELAKDHVKFTPKILNYVDAKVAENSAIKNVGGFVVNALRNKEYEFFDKQDDNFTNFVQNKKILGFEFLAKEKQKELLEKNNNDFKKALSEVDVADCADDYLLYILGIKDKDIADRAKKVRNKIEESIKNEIEQENKVLLAQLKKLVIDNFGTVAWDKWFNALKIYRLSNDEIVFLSPSKFNRDWIKREFLDIKSDNSFERIIKQLLPNLKKVSVICLD